MTNHYTLTLLLALFIGALPLLSQQVPTYSLFREIRPILNPASLSNNYLLFKQNISVGSAYRHQWIGIEDAPRTAAVWFEYVPRKQNFFTGAYLLNDKTGPFGATGIYGNFGYRLYFPTLRTQALAIGLNAGLVQYRTKWADIPLPEYGTPAELGLNDVFQPDFGFGLFYYYDDIFYAGLSVPQLLGLSNDFHAFTIERRQHTFMTIGVFIPLSSKKIIFEPSFLVRHAPNAPLSLDGQLRLSFQNLLWIALGYGNAKVLHTGIGVLLGEKAGLSAQQFGFSFGFERILADYGPEFGNVYELQLNYTWTTK